MSKKSEKVEDRGPGPANQNEQEMHAERMAIVKKARKKRNRELEDSDEIYSEGANRELIEKMNAEIAGEGGEGGESEAQAGAKAIEAAQGGEGDEGGAEAGKGGDEGQEPGQDDGKVDKSTAEVVIFGRTYTVPKADVDRAGGVEAYQKNRAASMRLSNAARMEAQLSSRKAELDGLEKKLTEREAKLEAKRQALKEQPSGQPAPASGDEPSDKDAQPIVDEERVTSLVNKIYSGKEDEAREAITDILTERAERNQPAISPEAVADLVVQRLQAQDTGKDEPKKPSADPGKSKDVESAYARQQREEVNRVMAAEYKDVLEDPDMIAVSQTRFKALRRDPANRGRQLTDIARVAGDYARKKFGVAAEIDRRQEHKRTLPEQTAAGGRKQPEQPQRPPSASEHIKRLRQSRGLE